MWPRWKQQLGLALDRLTQKVWKYRSWFAVSILLGMTFFVITTQICDATNCSHRDYHVIVMRYNFFSKRYLANVEQFMKVLFPPERKPRSYGDVQMTFLGSISIFNGTFEKSKAISALTKDKDKLKYRHVEITQQQQQYKTEHQEAVESQVIKPNAIHTLKEQQNNQIDRPTMLENNRIPNKIRIEPQPGNVRDLLSREEETKDKQGNPPDTTQNKKNLTLAEYLTIKDFRARAHRIAKLCPIIVRNRSRSQRKSGLPRAWQNLEVSMSRAETVKGVFWHRDTATAYCFVPKAGCTFWIRVFSFLQNFTGLAAQSPWDLPRLAVHTKRHNPYAHGAPLWYLVKEVMDPESLRFIVTRDPFSRLWSAYVDKLLLPDFWGNIGIYVVRRYRKTPTLLSRRCGYDVTFSEFVQYALTTSNAHWEPIYRRCDPCRFQPQVVADMNTFARDSTVVLRRMGMDDVLEDLNRTQQKERELSTLIQYNFDVINSTQHYKGCVTPQGVARLLWKAFQINGYIPVQQFYSPAPHPPATPLIDSPLPHADNVVGAGRSREQNERFSVSEFTKRVLQVFRESSSRLEKQLKAQRRHFMHEAYRALSPELLNRLRDVYRLDFQLFGYDESPFTV